MNDDLARPWYREFWVWFLLLVLAAGLASGIGVFVIGMSQAPQMVTGDYQKLGKALVDTRRRAEAAEALGLSARLSVDKGLAELTLSARQPQALPDQLLLRFEHPTSTERDIQVVALRVDGERWQADLSALEPPARARVLLSDLEQTWWLAGRYTGATAGAIGLDTEQL